MPKLETVTVTWSATFTYTADIDVEDLEGYMAEDDPRTVKAIRSMLANDPDMLESYEGASESEERELTSVVRAS